MKMVQNNRSQKEELLFEQKGNFTWAKGELMSLFWMRCSHFLDLSDGLKARNERHLQRIIYAFFFFALQHCTKPAFVKNAT